MNTLACGYASSFSLLICYSGAIFLIQGSLAPSRIHIFKVTNVGKLARVRRARLLDLQPSGEIYGRTGRHVSSFDSLPAPVLSRQNKVRPGRDQLGLPNDVPAVRAPLAEEFEVETYHSGHFPERTHDSGETPRLEFTPLDATLKRMLTLPRHTDCGLLNSNRNLGILKTRSDFRELSCAQKTDSTVPAWGNCDAGTHPLKNSGSDIEREGSPAAIEMVGQQS